MGFVASIILIYTVANEIISLLRAVGIVFLMNEALLGLTVLAWGNSIGGISFTIACVENDGNPVELEYGGPAPLLTAFIFTSLATSLVAFPVMKFRANRFYGFFLICLYFSFLIVIITYEFGLFVLPEIYHN
ncbi:hypothetical protein J437_LFUL010300 [Ladona fulva]|uniref:Sodium/calcium exchanger membrane region domain-containing protein n=1 Tax=Ladona fulva TaxID=123851 RepID=A0A8K0P3D6_LADFU|nr:hypothetical protein J437_LFUL010300 [Ladona fulva]